MSTTTRPRARLAERRLLVGLLVLMVVVDRSSAASAPWLATHHPLLLAGLDPTDKAILLAIRVSLVALFPVALARRLAGQSLYFLIGRRLGPEAKAWLARRGMSGPLARFEGAVGRWSYPAVFLAPREIVCILAGDLGMGWLPFLILVTLRDALAILVLRQLSEAFASQIASVLNFLNSYTLPVTLVAVGLVGVQIGWHRRRRRRLTATQRVEAVEEVGATELG